MMGLAGMGGVDTRAAPRPPDPSDPAGGLLTQGGRIGGCR